MTLHTFEPSKEIGPSPAEPLYNNYWEWHPLLSSLLALFSVCIITLAAAAKLEAPFRSDQSLFLPYARMLSQGFKLYTDIWDIKQPAIFWFYLASADLLVFLKRHSFG